MTGTKRIGWAEYALGLAFAAAARSEDPWHKVGAVILGADHAVLAAGYNGTFPGAEVSQDRDERRAFMVHAEQNALRYVTPASARGGMLAVTHQPCAECIKAAGSYMIKTVAWCRELDQSRYPLDVVMAIASKAGVEMHRMQTSR